jgi:GNAT superfamily N-acetyltransferase
MPPNSKFSGVDFSNLPIEHLTPDLNVTGQGFRCIRGEFATYWRKGRIQREVNARISHCWILRCEDDLAGYIAVDRRAEGAGRRLLEWAVEYIAENIAPHVGVRFITVDALYDSDTTPPYDASGFYKKFGFQFVNTEESLPPSVPYRTMYLDLKPLLDAMSIQI